MSISYYGGKPRQGKSYSVVSRVIIPALKKGRTVVTNIPMTDRASELAESNGAKLVQVPRGTTDILAFADMLLGDKSGAGEYQPNMDYAGAVFVLDEFMFLMPSGVKVAAIHDKVKAFFAMHGHVSANGYSTEIVILSQDASQFNAMVKGLVEQSFIVEKTMIGKKSVMNLKVYSGCAGAIRSVFVRSETHPYDVDVFPFYKTQTMSDSFGDESKTDDATNLLKLPALRYGVGALLLIPVAIYGAILTFSGLFSQSDPPAPSVDAELQQSSPTPPPLVPSAPPPAPLLAGYTLWLSANNNTNGKQYIRVRGVSSSGASIDLTPAQLRDLGYQVSVRLGLVHLVDPGGARSLLVFEPSTVTAEPEEAMVSDAINPFQTQPSAPPPAKVAL